jgi:methyltransferase-like protein/cyclopropane fatty-acyl-phospholipid synthase-like methyltransferase
MDSSGSTPTPYDVVPYPSRAQVRLHPERTATIARLLGVELADVRRCRVLELGCGDGVNLASMAVAHPESRFVGIDLASRPIAFGRELVLDAGLGNVELREGDLTALPDELGTFDYVIAHGVYSWVPPAVRDALLSACRRFLAPNGVAYVSYAVYPGCHLRELVRDMMLIHTDGIENPLEKVTEGKNFVRFVKEQQAAGPAYAELLAHELERLDSVSPEYLFHDDFSTENSPVYFGAFLQHAREHGLDFFAEAQFSSFYDPKISREQRRLLKALSAGDVAREEQYMDFLRLRAFRQTLLCHEGRSIDRTSDLERVFELFASSEMKPTSVPPALFDDTPELFRTSRGAELTTSSPILKVSLSLLGSAWPRALAVADLFRDARESLTKLGLTLTPDDRDVFARSLVQGAAVGLVELGVLPARFAHRPGERPEASPLVRAQARRGPEVTSLRHAQHHIADSVTRHLLTLLDGKRTRSELIELLKAHVEREPVEPKPVFSLESLDTVLGKMAEQALLVA